MTQLRRIFSRATVKPYRTGDLELAERPYLNAEGLVDFQPGDIENPHNWSKARRWYITLCTVLLVINASYAASSVSACFGVSFFWGGDMGVGGGLDRYRLPVQPG